jgi:hypothetical protein
MNIFLTATKIPWAELELIKGTEKSANFFLLHILKYIIINK